MTFGGDGQTYIICCDGNCRIRFSVPDTFYRTCRDDPKQWFYCPNGHHQHFSGKKSREELEADISRLRQQVAQRDDEIADVSRQRDAAKAKAAKIEKRAKAALCPCCNRHFENLARHLKTKHPEQNVVALKKVGTK